ncbi:MAG: thiamine pyrophosphate-binding protein [Rhodospirillales bacterium]|nr:thiamine pyrophosphate-binding protein [Rhodospirillales bacterium]
MTTNKLTGGSAFLTLLKDEGITHLFGNPGTTELPIMHALRDHQDLTYVLGLQEAIVVAMADGFSRASGKLSACNVHVAPGLGNAIGAIYNAKFTGTPMIITAGQQEQGHGLTEPLLYDPLVPMATPVVKWATEVSRLEDLPRIVRRAAKIATTPPTGPVFLSLPGDILNDEAGIDLGASTRVETRNQPTPAVLATVVDRMLAAERPVIIAGDELVKSNALAEAAQLAEVLGAAAYQQTVAYGAHFLSEHPCFMGTLSRDQADVQSVLAPYDLMIVLGADPLRMSVWSEISPLPAHMKIIHMGLNDWDMGKNYPAELAIRSDLKSTLDALLPVLRERGGAALTDRAKSRRAGYTAKNWSARRGPLVARLEGLSSHKPLDPDWVSLQIINALPENAVVVNEALTSTRQLNALRPYRDRYDYHALASGGIGWALPAAIGIQLADLSRPVCAIIGDGSAMYSIQALWTAAHLKLPMTYIITNNASYRIIKQRLLAFHKNSHFVGMDFSDPPLDFTAIAQGMGLTAERITEADALAPALAAAFAHDGPNLLDIAVDGHVG